VVNEHELSILQAAFTQGIHRGFLEGTADSNVYIISDPPSICVHMGTDNSNDSSDHYYDPLFPIFERDWAVAFWGRDLVGDALWGTLPAWKYHQHILLTFLQNGEMKEFYNYLNLFL
jgi:hypothetical protein